MNAITYMSYYAEALEALEDFDRYDDLEGATESIGRDVAKAQNSFNSQFSAASAELQARLKEKDEAGAMKAVDQIEKLIDQAIKDAENIPPDKFIGIRKIGKIALAIIGLIIMIKSGKSFDLANKLIAKTPASAVIKSALSKAPAFARSKTAKNVAKMAVTGKVANFGFKAFMSGAKDSIQNLRMGSKAEFDLYYGKNPNAASAVYRKYFDLLQNEKQSIPEVRQAVKEYCRS